MLVDVVELRWQGRRLPDEDVKARRPARGRLQLHAAPPRRRSEVAGVHLVAQLIAIDGRHRELLAPLGAARVVKIASGSMLIVGMQEYERGIRSYERVRQAWWIRPVADRTP